MFFIKHLGCEVTDRWAKVHIASTPEIAQEVMEDLKDRFGGDFVLEELDNNTCRWDPGGMAMMDDETFAFPLDNCILECDAQHYECMIDILSHDSVPRGNTAKYIKIHGAYNCICITPDEYNALVQLTDDSDLTNRAEESRDKLLNKLGALNDAGVVKSVVKDSDGNLYGVNPKPLKYDKKDLN